MSNNGEHFQHRVGFEVLTAMVMNSPIFWDITPYSPLKVTLNGLHSIIYQKIELFISSTFSILDVIFLTCLSCGFIGYTNKSNLRSLTGWAVGQTVPPERLDDLSEAIRWSHCFSLPTRRRTMTELLMISESRHSVGCQCIQNAAADEWCDVMWCDAVYSGGYLQTDEKHLRTFSF
jgi:hypothetical protein